MCSECRSGNSFADILEQFPQRRRRGAFGIVFAEYQFFSVSRLNALVFKLQPGKFTPARISRAVPKVDQASARNTSA